MTTVAGVVKRGGTIVFAGDSITEAGRVGNGLGTGYVYLLQRMVERAYPDSRARLVNRGVGGDTIRDLARRWEQDVLSEEPGAVCISIGINDVWRQLEQPPDARAVPLHEFREHYAWLLKRTREWRRIPIALLEPSIIGEDADTPHNQLLAEYLEAVRELARTHDCELAPVNAAFWQAIRANPESVWTTDGVHPLQDGQQLIAACIWDALNLKLEKSTT